MVTISIPGTGFLSPKKAMGTSYNEKEVRVWIMGFGLVLVLTGVALIASWTTNVLLLPMGFFVFILGVAVLTTGFVTARWDRPPVPKVRCRECSALNYETAIRCRKCGASMS